MALPSRLLYQLVQKELFKQATQVNARRSISCFHFQPALQSTTPPPALPLSSISISATDASTLNDQNTSALRGYRFEPFRCAASGSSSPLGGQKTQQEPKTLPSVEADDHKSVKSGTNPGTEPEQEPKTLPSIKAVPSRPSGSRTTQRSGATPRLEQQPKTLPFVNAAETDADSKKEEGGVPKQEAAPGVAEAKRMIKDEAKREEIRNDRDDILEAALTHVVTLGWSDAALAAGAKDMGLSPAAGGMFRRGGVELLEYFIEQCNNKLAKEVEEEGSAFSALSTRDKLVQAIKLRLEMQAPYVTTWPKALALQALPQNIPTSVQQRARLVDILWEVTGDTSVDSSWYAKRGLVAAVYGATEVYMLTDFSPGFAETWKFLNRRIDEAVELKKSADEFKHLAQTIGAGLGGTFGSALNQLMRGGGSSKRRS